MRYSNFMSDPQFIIHNSHLEGPDQFGLRDPQLRILSKQKYVYLPPLVEHLPNKIPGIYTIFGGRQIGKTTLSKQWMQYLLRQGVQPESIVYFTGEVIVDHLSMIRQLQAYLETMPQGALRYVIVDEVTYIKDWDMGVKFLADAGLLENTLLILTGSDSIIIQEARMRFPGRRGRANQVDFHIYPLSFYEYLKLTDAIANLDESLQSDVPSEKTANLFRQAFESYLLHGGYLTAINNYAEDGQIDKMVLDTYADWIRGDVIKHGKSDHYCREFFTAMQKRLNSQVTWSALAKDFSIEHHKTIAEYAILLESMDAIFIQQALREDKLTGAPKKARKLIFTDPFIYHAIGSWLKPCKNPFLEQIIPAVKDSKISSYLVEASVSSHISRWYPTYYIKGEGEVDVAYVKDSKFWPIEVKWTEQCRVKDLKQIQKYRNGIILAKQSSAHKVNNTPSYPLPWYLAKLGYENQENYINTLR